MPFRSRREALVVAACVLVFLVFAASWLHLPGPQEDEMLPVPVLSPVLRPTVLFSLDFDAHWIPLMVMSYVGALKGLLLRLWFLVVPVGVPGYRAFGIAVGLLTLGMIYWFVRRYWGSPVALLSFVLVSTDPSFVHTIRIDYGPVVLAHFFKMSGLCLLSRWLDKGSRWALGGGMFLFGLGVWDKANFTWFLAGLGMTVFLLFPREAFQRLRARPGTIPIAAAALLLGASPFIAYNLKQSGQTWRERGRLEIRWFKLLQAQGTFNGDFMSVLTGEDMLELSPPARDVAFPRVADWMYRVGRLRQTIIIPLLAVALLALPFNLRIARPKALLFPLLLSILTYACMFVTFDGGASAHHVIMLQPFPLLFLAASLWTSADRWPGILPRAVAVATVVSAVVVNLSVNARHLAIYTRTGGMGAFSDAVYRLVPYLAEHPEWKLYAIDWGFSTPAAFLGLRRNLTVDEVFFSLNNPKDPNHPQAVEQLAKLMRDRNSAFLLHSPQRTLFPAPAQAFFALAESGIEMRQVAFFEERSGEMVYEVYRPGPSVRPDMPPEIPVEFFPTRVAPNDSYVIQVKVKELRNTWIDLVYHVDRVSGGTATRFCRLDAEGRARLVVPATHPAATVRITLIRPTGGQWRPARGSIQVVR